jgi:hypothetical protein
MLKNSRKSLEFVCGSISRLQPLRLLQCWTEHPTRPLGLEEDKGDGTTIM